jgi:hypothetical protein
VGESNKQEKSSRELPLYRVPLTMRGGDANNVLIFQRINEKRREKEQRTRRKKKRNE